MLPDTNLGTDTDIDYRNEVADPNATAYNDDESNDILSSPQTACNNRSLSNNLICQWMLCWRKDWSTCMNNFSSRLVEPTECSEYIPRRTKRDFDNPKTVWS